MAISKFVTYKGKYWAGLTTKNHLGRIFQLQPQKASQIVGVLLQTAGMRNIDTVLSKLPIKYLDDEGDFTWKLVGSFERTIPLIEARWNGDIVLDTTENVGAQRTVVELIFGERYFSDVQVISGEKPDIYQFRILGDPYEEAINRYVYQVEIWGGDLTKDGIPGYELLPGHRFSIEGSPVESTMSIKGSDIEFSSPFEMKNTTSRLRIEHKVPGNMLTVSPNTDICYSKIEIVDPSNPRTTKTFTTWMQEVFWRIEQRVSRLKALGTMFGISNRSLNGDFLNEGKSGFVIEGGSGIREQMEVANVIPYNNFSLSMLEDMLHELSEGKLEMDERKFVIRTGERGAKQFHQAVNTLGVAWTPYQSTNNPASIQKTSSPLHPNALKGGYQFTEWVFANNIHVMVEVDPMYDDKVRNKILHPSGGVAESYRYDILYMGPEREPNIQKVSVKGMEDIRGYQWGFRNPFTGQVGNMDMGRMEDSATITVYGVFGAMVKDPTRTASYIPTILFY